jgi:hypothetical protein
MKENDNSNGSISKRNRRHWLFGRRTNGLFGGILLVAIGFYWLGKKAGWFSLEIHVFWPIVLIIIGVWVIAGVLVRREK